VQPARWWHQRNVLRPPRVPARGLLRRHIRRGRGAAARDDEGSISGRAGARAASVAKMDCVCRTAMKASPTSTLKVNKPKSLSRNNKINGLFRPQARLHLVNEWRCKVRRSRVRGHGSGIGKRRDVVQFLGDGEGFLPAAIGLPDPRWPWRVAGRSYSSKGRGLDRANSIGSLRTTGGKASGRRERVRVVVADSPGHGSRAAFG